MPVLLLTLALCLAIPNAVQAAGIPDSIAAAVASSGRSAADRERDERDQPAALMAFAGVRPGMTVADIFGGGGYWSELFALAVGSEGHVDLVNNVGYFYYAREGLKARFADGRMESITRHVVESCDLELGQARVDLAVIFMSYHDLYYVDPASGWPRIDASGFLEQVHAAIKPGGYLLIVDHAAVAGSGSASAQDLHRIDERYAQADIESHGFELERTWDGYRNPADDLTKPVFDPAVRGKTDRFTHLYRRP
jgi:predicted methyltransferase